MCSPNAPEPPDPIETARGQTSTNIGTSIANTMMGNVNQNTPTGTVRHRQTGTYNYTDPVTGEAYEIPQFTSTTRLTPEGQEIQDENLGAQLGLAQTANQQASFLRDYLGEPADFNTEEIEDRLYELGSARLDPRFAREKEATETRLANQGVAAGSDAYNSEMERLTNSENDAYNQLMLGGRGQAFGEMAAMRNQPINEITALLSGSQVSQPQFAPAQPQSAATTDYAGLVNQNYNQQMGAYNQQNANRNTIMGGLFGLGSAFLI